MHNSKYEKKRRTKVTVLAVIIIAALILSLAAPLFTAFSQTIEESEKTAGQMPSFEDKAYDDEKSTIKLTVNAGYNGRFVVGKSTPVTISAVSETDFKGYIEVKYTSPDYEYDNTEYVYYSPVDLTNNISKNIKMNVFIPYNTNYVDVLALDENKKTVGLKKIELEPINSTYISTGIISENLDELKYLQNLELEDNTNKTSGFKTFFLSENQSTYISNEELENFDVLIMSNFDTKKFNEDTLKNIKNWLNNGGMLVLGSPEDSLADLDGLKSIVDFSNKKEIYLNDVFDDNSDKEIQLKALNDIFPNWNLNEGDLNINIASEILIGKGKVLIQKFNLPNLNNSYELSNNKNLNKFLSDFYFRNFPQKIINKSKSDMYYNDIYSILDNSPLFKTDKVVNLFIIIFIYIFIIFPLLYVILKKYDKREYGWFIIPILSVFITIIIFSLGSNSFYKKSIVNTISFVNVDGDNNFGDVLNYTSIKSPEKGDVIYTNNKKLSANLGESRSYRHNSRNAQHRILQDDTEKTVINFSDNIRWNSNYFSSDFLSNLDGNVSSYFKLVGNRIEGNIENKTNRNFYDVVLNINGNFVKLDSLEKGKVLNINYSLDELKTDSINDFIDDNFETQEEIKERLKSGEINEIDANKLIKRGSILNYYNDSKVSDYNYNSRFLNNKSFYVEMYAFNNDLLLGNETKVNNKSVNEINDNVYIFDFNIDYKASQDFEIPYNFIKPEIISIDGDTDVYYKDYNYAIEDGSTREIKSSFKIPQELNADSFQIKYSDFKNSGAMIFNSALNEWEHLKEEEYKNASDYIDRENKIVIKLNLIDKENIDFPEIKIVGVN